MQPTYGLASLCDQNCGAQCVKRQKVNRQTHRRRHRHTDRRTDIHVKVKLKDLRSCIKITADLQTVIIGGPIRNVPFSWGKRLRYVFEANIIYIPLSIFIY